MKVNRSLLLIAAIVLQVCSWIDIQSLVQRLLPLGHLNPLQTAQTVGSGVLLIVYWATSNGDKQCR